LSDATAPNFTDLVLGLQISTLMPKNFVIKRRDGLIAYQLATAVDDMDEGYTHIIRGSDLLDSTFRQMAIHKALGKLSPRYGHLPLVTDSLGNKLSKQAGAQAVDVARPVANLRLALDFLNQPSPPTAAKSIGDVLHFATEHWRLSQLN
jgi:glutamyl-Q tRNA(Asp) synthetase